MGLSYCLRHRMLHFLQNFVYYVTLEVVGPRGHEMHVEMVYKHIQYHQYTATDTHSRHTLTNTQIYIPTYIRSYIPTYTRSYIPTYIRSYIHAKANEQYLFERTLFIYRSYQYLAMRCAYILIVALNGVKVI